MWKIYFFIYLLLNIIGYTSLLSNDRLSGILVPVDIIVTIVSTVGLYYFVFEKKISSRVFWQRVFWGFIGINLVLMFLSYFPEQVRTFLYNYQSKPEANTGIAVISTLINILIIVPKIYALYSLAYKKQKTKKRKEPQNNRSVLATVSFITALFGIFVPILVTIPAAFLGIMALEQIATDNLRGKYMAWFSIGLLMLQSFTLVVVSIVLLLTYYGNNNSFAEMLTGPKAVSQMNSNELKFLKNNLEKITTESSSEEVTLLLGEPYAAVNLKDFGKQLVYSCPETTDEDCAIRVNFHEDKAYEVRWEYQGKFDYTVDIRKPQQTI